MLRSRGRRARLRGRRARRAIAAARGHAGVRLQLGGDPRAVRAARHGARRRPAPHSLHAQGELQPGDPAPAARVRRAASTSCPAASCIARCAAASRRTDIVFGGVGKTRARARARRSTPACCWSTSSREAELRLLDGIARRARRTVAPLALRVNPEVTVDTPHAYITDRREGAQVRHSVRRGARRRARSRASLPNVELVGLDMHVGSQLSRLEPYDAALERLLELLDAVRADGITIAPRISTSAAGSACRTTTRSRPTSSAIAAIVVTARRGDRARAHRRAGPLPRRQRGRAADAGPVPEAQRRQGDRSSPTPA